MEKMGVCSAVTLGLVALILPGCTSPQYELEMTLLIYPHNGRYPAKPYTFMSGKDTLAAVDVDFWGRDRLFVGEAFKNQPPHRFYGFHVNLQECQEIASIAEQLGVDSSQIEPLKMGCHQPRGLLAVTASILGTFPNHTEDFYGHELRGTMSTSVLDVEAVYDDEQKKWIFIDSIHIDPYAYAKNEKRYGFGYGRFDQTGEHCYYIKRDSVLRYNLLTGRIDTVYGGDTPGIPFNSMDLLILSRDTEQLHLLDAGKNIVASVPSSLKMIYDVGKVSDSVFVVAGWEYTLFGYKRDILYLFDFRKGTKEKLIDLPGITEILEITTFPVGSEN